MGFNCGIVGLPNAGKSTIFNALTSAKAEAANYPFCTIEPNVGIVKVPDRRLDDISAIFSPKKITPTTLEFVDIAGLIKGASKGEGLGNQFLAKIREVTAIVNVVRCFENPDIVHVEGTIDPIRDIEIVNTELMLADLESISKKLNQEERAGRAGDKKAMARFIVMKKVNDALENGIPVRKIGLTPEEIELVKDFNLLTGKKVLYVANTGEDMLHGETRDVHHVKAVEEYAAKEGSTCIAICGSVEAEIAQLDDPAERKDFLASMGLEETGLDKLIRHGYKLLNLVTFFTAGEPEVRAWTVRKGAFAPQAAGVIHTDFERGFIRAEVYRYEDLLKFKSEAALKDKGLLRLEGKEYEVKDGDVMFFRFNV